ncbi:tetratricopeptide repeat protein [Qipengyuania sp. S6317L1]|uniref:O-linked N-acetylglucosamine transferase, SPINDLY family protein n=1 Tax=Qipengyuania sp. S6317L1 TaxID=2926410 RepID=UPI001FF53ADA|nr:tetratricopeptide repeat protein [Qipengyuania sp. S6317L1]
MQLTPADKDALVALFRKGDFAACFARADALTRSCPDALDAWNLRGAAALQLGRLADAIASFRKLEALAPELPSGPYNLGMALEQEGHNSEAMAAYRRAISRAPQSTAAQINLARLAQKTGQVEVALEHLTRASELQPHSPEAHNNLGTVLEQLGRSGEAHAAYSRAIELKPDFAEALYNQGTLESARGGHQSAADAFRKALASDPANALAKAMLIHELSHVCDWDAMAEFEAAIPKLGVEGAAVPPFVMLHLEDNPENQLSRARNWAKTRYGSLSVVPRTFARPKSRPQRLRIAYLSADFHDHPGMRLMSGMLEEHDRSRFDVHAVSYGRTRSDTWRDKAAGAVDHFHDVHGKPEGEVLELLTGLEIDIAIERQGYTQGTRIDRLAHRIAPVQISFLGYCSGTSLPFIDYMIADNTVIPDDHRAYYDDNIIWLPDCYQPGNNTLTIGAARTTRGEHALPEEAVVLCCFNNLYKLRRQVFAVWMRIMHRVTNSVLWLLGSNEEAHENLRKAAANAGVDPARLIFAPRLPHAQHLERHAHADLFIDSGPYGAHTTCNDALYAGLPVVTRMGEQMSARVAASVIKSVDLQECITHSWDEYEALVVEIAGDMAKAGALRKKLSTQRMRGPMFDTARYTRHLEDGYDAAYKRFLECQPAADISVRERS